MGKPANIVLCKKIEIKPTFQQQQLINKSYGVARYCYNTMLADLKAFYEETGKSSSTFDLRKRFNYSEDNKFFVSEVPSKIKYYAALNVYTAFQNYFAKRAKHPQFKAKKTAKKSFTVEGSIAVSRGHIKLPKLGWVALKEYGYLPVGAQVTRATVSESGGKTFVSINYKVSEQIQPQATTGEGVGIDLGLKDLAIVSDGRVFGNINKKNHVKRLEKRLKREQRRMSRKFCKGEDYQSANYMKAKARVARLHARLANIREEYRREVISQVIKREPSFITIEHLNISGMLKNRHLSRAISQQGFFNFVSWLTYQCKKNGIELRQVNRFYPSTKMCSCCGFKQPMKLSQRIYRCGNCDMVADRDLNASINLMQAQEYTILT